jgi:uncharacterized protein (DUF885 family)
MMGVFSMIALIALLGSGGMPPASATLDRLADSYWQRQLQTNYYLRLQLGQPIETIRPISIANADDDARFAQQTIDSLAAIDPNGLDHDRWLTYRTLQFIAKNDVAARDYFWLTQIATPYAGGSQLALLDAVFSGFTFKSHADEDRYLSLVHQYAEFVRSMRIVLEGQHARGFILPVVEIDPSEAVFSAYDVPAKSSPLLVSDARLNALPSAERTAFQQRVQDLVAKEVVPTFDSMVAYLKGPYRVGAPAQVGLSQYRGGSAYYAYLVKYHTTLDVGPAELHALGMSEVDKLTAQLDGIRREVGFSGDLTAFKKFLETDKQFFPKTTSEFGDRLETYVHRAEPAVPKFFERTPRTPYGVQALPQALAGSQTFGYYDAATHARPKGLYLYNAWHPDQTAMLGAGALICHELLPGHHFQIALQQENDRLPDIRHYDFSETGFVEGWGEYASQLCWDMGVYQSPYDRAGRVMQDLMVSTRLVVDTGMNAMGWSRERAMQFMRDHVTLSERQIESETLRYSTDIPGQALAYKTGELTMLQLRDHAKQELGPAFDIRQFHSWVLDSGSMTLDTLKLHVDYEIKSAKANLASAGSSAGN